MLAFFVTREVRWWDWKEHTSLSLSCDTVRLYSGRESSDNILLGHVVRKHGLLERYLWICVALIASIFVAHCPNTELAIRSVRF